MITPFFNNISPFEDVRSNHNNNNNNNNNNTYIVLISIYIYSYFHQRLKIKISKKNRKKILTLHKVYIQKVHEPTKKSKTIMSTLKL